MLYLAIEVIAGASCTFLRALLFCPHLFVTITEVSCMRKPGSLEIVKHQILFNIYFRWAYFLHLKKVKCHNNHFNIPHFLFVDCVCSVAVFTHISYLYITFFNHHLLVSPLSSSFHIFPFSAGRESLWSIESFLNLNLPALFSSLRIFS